MHVVIVFKSLFWVFFSPWIDNKQLFVVEGSPRQDQVPAALAAVPSRKKICWAPAPGRAQPPRQPGPHHEQAEQTQGTEKQVTGVVAAWAGCLSPNFILLALGHWQNWVRMDMCWRATPFTEALHVPSWIAKPARGCALQEEWILPKLLLVPCCPSPTSR